MERYPLIQQLTEAEYCSEEQEMSGVITEQQLRAFLAVAKYRSFTRAAQFLSYSQPAVSLHIKTLEATLGQPLFTRSGTHIELTGAGHRLQIPFAEALERLEAVRQELWAAVKECGSYALEPSTPRDLTAKPALFGPGGT